MTSEHACPISCRSKQYNLLSKFYIYPSIYIWGSSSTGKTMTVTSVLMEKDVDFILVNCIELFSANLIFKHIIDDFYNEILNQTPPDVNINNNISLFCSILTNAITIAASIIENFSLQIIFKNVERLANLSDNLLPFLLQIPEKTDYKVKVIFISHKTLSSLSENGELTSQIPIQIHFPTYTRDEYLKLLEELGLPPNSTKFQYTTYCKAVVYGVIKVTRDLNEIINLTKDYWPIYYNLCQKYQDEPTRWNQFQKFLDGTFENNFEGLSEGKIDIQLPYFSKYLLLAAYIASFNPPKYDLKFFGMNKGKITRKEKINNKKQKHVKIENNLKIFGPKVFNRERWFHIFEAIIPGNKFRSSLCLQSSVTTLCDMNLIVPQKPTDLTIPVPEKYLININYSLALKVSKNVGFEDFVDFLVF